MLTIELIPGTGAIAGMDLYQTIAEELHAGTPDLAPLILYWMTENTPIRSGALAADEFANPITDAHDPTLIDAGIGTRNQLDEYGRLYAAYQEGPSLGLATFTNDPHHMIQGVIDNHAEDIAAWAYERMDGAITRCVNGTGVPHA